MYEASEISGEFITEAFFEIMSSSMLQQVKFSAVENLYRIGGAHLKEVHCQPVAQCSDCGAGLDYSAVKCPDQEK